MACRVFFLLALGVFGHSLAESCVDDSHNFVQRVLEVRPAKHKDNANVELHAAHKQTADERKAEPITRKLLKETISGSLKKVPNFPVFLVGTLQDQLVPKFMEARRNMGSTERKLMDGVVRMNLLAFNDANLTTKLEELSVVTANADLQQASASLHNASIILPPVLATMPHLLTISDTFKLELSNKATPLVKAFAEDIMPEMQEFTSKASNLTASTLSSVMPLVQSRLNTLSSNLTELVKGVLYRLDTDADFAELRKAAHEVAGMTNFSSALQAVMQPH